MSSSFIAKRYLTAAKGSGFLSWITVLSISGITIGVAAMIVVLSVINGFETELRKRFLAANAHILAFQYPHGLDNIEQWIQTFDKDFGDELTGISPFVHSETMITKESLMHNVLIRGVDPELRKSVQDYGELITPKNAMDLLQLRMKNIDSTSVPPIVLGSGLATLLNAKVGDVVSLIYPEANQAGELRKYAVVGIYDSGLRHYDNKLGIVALPDAQNLFNMKDRVHGLEIGLKSPNDSILIAARMGDKYTMTVKEWQSFNRPMFEAMKMERSVISLIVALVAFVASFNILTTLFIVVTQKQRSISILKSLGASNGYVMRTFISQGFFIGIVGATLGMALAFIISLILERYQIVDLPDLYLLVKLPIKYDYKVYLSMAAAGAFICLVAGIYPAWVAARLNIVDGFKGRSTSK
ncbi:MAG: ABC transporter permease [Proteobacteria bacterium]|nr:ABC transporter permease [Pseudomonadota bacterium]